MNSFGELLTRKRKEAGLSQKALAERMNVTVITIQNWERGRTKMELSHLGELAHDLNIPVEELIKELVIQESSQRPVTWPWFLFDDHTNEIVSTLHLNLRQQDLFGVLYIYKAEYLQKRYMSMESIQDSLDVVPFEFINKVGSIQFLNIAEGLERVLRYVQTDFLLKVLKESPEEEFDVCRMNKNQICEFLECGYKPVEDNWEDSAEVRDNALSIEFDISYAREMLPILAKQPLHLADVTDGCEEYATDWPREVLQTGRMKEILRLNKNPEGEQRNTIIAHTVHEELFGLAKTVRIKKEDGTETIVLEITEKGRSLLNWFNDKE